jgi:pyridoxine 4-dehydrogenase
VRSLGLDRLDMVNLRMGDRGHTDIVCVQNLYNIAAREDDPLVDACARDGIAYIPFFPVGGHRPLTAEHLSKVAARLGATAPQVALAWLLARSRNMVLIPGDRLAGTSGTEHRGRRVAVDRRRPRAARRMNAPQPQPSQPAAAS